MSHPMPESGHHRHGASTGHESHHGHGAESKDRPIALVLGGFGGFNLLVVLAAVVLRRRPAAIKRRETLARVRRAAVTQEGHSTPGARP